MHFLIVRFPPAPLLMGSAGLDPSLIPHREKRLPVPPLTHRCHFPVLVSHHEWLFETSLPLATTTLMGSTVASSVLSSSHHIPSTHPQHPPTNIWDSWPPQFQYLCTLVESKLGGLCLT